MEATAQLYAGKTALITGATGFTGRALTHKLSAAGVTVKAIARQSSSIGDLEALDIKWYRGEVFDPDVVKAAVEGTDYIFHLAAVFREEMPTDDDYRPVHLHSTQLLAKAANEVKGFKRFLHVSTVGVHGHIEVDRADENYRFSCGDGYQRTKLEGEQWIADYGRETDFPYTIIRPAPIYGPGDLRLLKLFRMVNKGYLLMLGKGKAMFHLVHVEDLANTIMLSAVSDRARSEVLISAGDEPISIENMARTIGKTLKKDYRTIRLPIQPFYWSSDFLKFVCKPIGIQPPIYRRRVDFYTKDRSFDNSKIKEYLGYNFIYDNIKGIEATTRWYVDHGLLS